MTQRPFLRVAPHRAPVTAVYGGGGVFGIAYGLGVAHALMDGGVPLDQGEALGTSAGSWVASCLALGIGFDVMSEQPGINVPQLRPGFLQSIAKEILGDRRDPRVTAAVMRLPMRHELLNGLRLADMVAASSSVPGVFAPCRIGRRLYVDGGVRSMASAHRAPDADHLVVVAPIAGRVMGPGGRALEVLLGEEARRWQLRTGGRAHIIRPDAAIAAMVSSPWHLFDKARALDVYPMAYAQGQRLVTSRPNLNLLRAA